MYTKINNCCLFLLLLILQYAPSTYWSLTTIAKNAARWPYIKQISKYNSVIMISCVCSNMHTCRTYLSPTQLSRIFEKNNFYFMKTFHIPVYVIVRVYVSLSSRLRDLRERAKCLTYFAIDNACNSARRPNHVS